MAHQETEQKQESRFESIFNHVNEGILIANQHGEIVLTNPKIPQMFGYEESELLGKKVEVLVPRENRSNHVADRQGYMADPQKRPMGKDLILFGQRKDGFCFPVEISLSHYSTINGRFVIAFVIDITERYEHQEKIKRINEELKLLNETLERKVNERTLVLREALNSLENSRDELTTALEKEKELNEMKSRFISMASHEFRTPLSAILSSASLIGKYHNTDEQDKRDKHVSRIKNAVHNLTDILNDILSLGKLEEGIIRANLSNLNLCELVDEVLSELSGIFKPGQKATYHHSADCMCVADKQLMRNILINLISNAIKFSPENDTIELTSSVDNKGIHMKIKDSGIGISEEDQRHLFERFFRGRNATNIQGTGLGLNIVMKYLELMDGHITCQSELEKGSTFSIFIPHLHLS